MNFKLSRFFDSIAFRTIRRHNVVNIKTLKPNYWDRDAVMLHAIMQIIVDFVELELSALSCTRNQSWWEKVINFLPWYFRPIRRSADDGLKHIDSFMNELYLYDEYLDSEYLQKQVKFYKDLKHIYLWWKNVYPHRKSLETVYAELNDEGEVVADDVNLYINLYVKTEDAYLEEEQNMLNLAISIRPYLWT